MNEDIDSKPIVLVISEEEYLNMKGHSFMSGAEPALHKNIQPGRAKDQAIARVSKAMRENNSRRAELRIEYWTKVTAGLLRPPTRTERLIQIAKGHEDLASTHAARTILEAKNIPWE